MDNSMRTHLQRYPSDEFLPPADLWAPPGPATGPGTSTTARCRSEAFLQTPWEEIRLSGAAKMANLRQPWARRRNISQNREEGGLDSIDCSWPALLPIPSRREPCPYFGRRHC
ncbi:unnamed protein product [Nesidiocoris tenuis]|uniref:Uncharacterized protein n=1 Tax=Nesidiocoris tenuis TaxID=355587 RepID=A0A6H5G7M1_9HEMI|nr:unnamed protein product [Nesidiocoris tenuis]